MCYIFLVCVCSLIYPAYKVHAPYFSSVACPVFAIFFPTFSERHNLKEKVIKHKMLFDFLYKFCLNNFSSRVELSDIMS